MSVTIVVLKSRRDKKFPDTIEKPGTLHPTLTLRLPQTSEYLASFSRRLAFQQQPLTFWINKRDAFKENERNLRYDVIT